MVHTARPGATIHRMTAALLDEIKSLSARERLDLIEEIWESIRTADEVPVPQSHQEELDRRLDALATDASPGDSWANVRERVRGSR